MRALEPTLTGYAHNPADGVRSYYEAFGSQQAADTIVFLPTWSLVHSRVWKMQAPYFARRGFRVVTFDGRGNGNSDRPACGYTTNDFTQDTLAVCDALGIERAALVGYSAGGRWGIQFAAQYPERVSQLVLIAPSVRLHGGARLALDAFLANPPDREGWNKFNAVHWREQYDDFVIWFVSQLFSEPHSTKPFDNFVAWGHETSPDVLIATTVESASPHIAEHARSITCPVLLIHGSDDQVAPLTLSTDLLDVLPDARLVILEGSGHAPSARDPVKVNLLIHAFLNEHREAAGYARA